MAHFNPKHGRAKIIYIDNTLEIIIPSEKNWTKYYIALVWLSLWIGPFVIIPFVGSFNEELFRSELPFFLVFLVGWVAVSSLIILYLLWMPRGQERVRINEYILVHSRELFRWSWSKRYVLPTISRIRVEAMRWQIGWRAPFAMFGLYGGSVVFYYQDRNHEFGAGLSEAEATHIVDLIHQRFPSIKIAK